MNVLIVDDDEDGAESLALWLRLEGHEVRVVADGKEALKAFDAALPHVVILDISMPGMDGYEVARRMRGSPSGPVVTLIAVTGWGEEGHKERALQAGFNHYFTRPVEPERLSDVIRSSAPK